MMAGRKRRIALVDDHRMFADGFGVLLASLRPGYQVQTFDEPVAFLKRLEAGETFDLIKLAREQEHMLPQ
ncbi:hypothetical protein [Maricaulis sp.]|uniref:hypothetical protein n=1 Tax=Maricaulis sp. TaxID=1486257 RepID=UPI0025BDA72B|nr:hypothetical protein [Maricaulis sp.]